MPPFSFPEAPLKLFFFFTLGVGLAIKIIEVGTFLLAMVPMTIGASSSKEPSSLAAKDPPPSSLKVIPLSLDDLLPTLSWS